MSDTKTLAAPAWPTALAHGSEYVAQIVGTDGLTTASLAACVNGTLGHARDFGDTHNASVM